MGKLIGLIIIGIALVGGIYFLLRWRKFKKNIATIYDKKKIIEKAVEQAEGYLWTCAVFFVYGISVWALDGVACPCSSGGEPMSIWGNLFWSILATAGIAIGILCAYGLFYELFYKILYKEVIEESLSKISEANKEIDKAEAEKKAAEKKYKK
ncbi:MAG: hypothetical protein LBD11_07155 [Candidatus Peribacteria bacterium]|jgi:hypothetical protein|nr:hypothetical protein [Candidatus Peribacteria bacterium]